MKIVYDQFRGIRPRQSRRSLPPGYGQVAENVRARSDDLESWREPGEVQTLAKGSVIQSLFLLARQYWLHWNEDVDVARGPIPPETDDSERTYITGLDRPRMTNVELATVPDDGDPDDGRYPYRTVALGMPAPADPVTVEQTLSADASLDDEEVQVSNGGDLAGAWTTLIGGEDEDSTVNVVEVEELTGSGELDAPFIRMTGGEYSEPVIYRDAGTANALASRYRVEYAFSHSDHFRMMFVIGADEDGNGVAVALDPGPPFIDPEDNPEPPQDYSDSATDDNSRIRLYAVTGWRTRSALLNNGQELMVRASGQTIQADVQVDSDNPGQVTITLTVDVLSDTAGDYTTDFSFNIESSHIKGGFFGAVTGVTESSPQDDLIGSLTVAAIGEISDGTLTSYVHTLLNQFSEESAPSPATSTVNLADGVDTTITIPDAQPADEDFKAYGYRVYRVATGATGSAFLLHTETLYADPDSVAPEELTFVDDKDDEDLGEPLESELFDLPPVDGRNILALPNDVMVMSVGNQVCPSVQGRPHAYPVDYRVTTDYDIVALAAIDTTVYALTESHAYMIIGSNPAQFSMAKIPQAYACVSRRSVAALARYGVVYASPDGLVVVTTSGARLISEPWITKREWEQYRPETLIGVAHDDIYFGFYREVIVGGGGAEIIQGGFVFDPDPDGFGFAPLDEWAHGVHVDALTDTLYFTRDDVVYAWEAGSERLTYTWRGRLERLPYPVAFNCAVVDAEDYEDITARYYGDGQLIGEYTVTGPGVYRIAPLRDGSGRASTYREFELELTGRSRVYAAETGNDVAELS